MNLSKASAEPFVRFLRFNTAFNSQFKVSVAALVHVSKVVSGAGGTRVMQGLVTDTGEPWATDVNWANPSETLRAALADTTRLGVLQVHSAIDAFVEDVKADVTRWSAFEGTPQRTATDADSESDPLERLHVELLNGSASDFDELRPLLRYFRLARNCIAHRSSRASPALSALSRHKELSKALDSLSTKGAPPSLPTCAEGTVIEMMPRLAILALAVAYRAAAIVNRKEVQLLSTRGMVHHAAHFALFQGVRLDGVTAYRSPQAVLADALSNRYRVRGINGDSAIAAAKRSDVWGECRKAFNALYGVPPTKS